MPIVLAVLSVAAGVYFFLVRARNAAHIASDVVNAVGDTRLAVRRLKFRHRANTHPADAIEHADEAIAGIAAAFVELEGAPTQERLAALETAFRRSLRLQADEAQELVSYARWMTAQCGTPNAAILRLSGKLNQIEGPAATERLMDVLKTVIGEGALSDQQREALQDIARRLNLR